MSKPGTLKPGSQQQEVSLPSVTFSEHKEQTANDCEQVAKMLTDLAKQVREGNLKAFEGWWIEGGTEEGDAKIQELRERIVLRYLHREERQANAKLCRASDGDGGVQKGQSNGN